MKKCLAKDPAGRWQSAKDLLDVLEWTAAAAHAEAAAASPRSNPRPGRLVLAAVVAAIAAGLAVGVAFQQLSPQAPEANRYEFTVTAPSGAPFSGLLTTIPFHLAVSPDGRHLAFLTQPGLAPGSVLWIRPTGSIEARRIDGSEGASYPFWSPDSRSVAFFAGGKLKKIDVDGGQPITLSDAQSVSGGAWGPDGTIVFTRIGSDPVLYRVPASGGDVVPIAIGEVAGRKLAYVRWPQFLPDGRQLVVQSGPPDTLYAVPLEGGTPTPLVKADTAGMFAAGHLVYQRQSVLYAQPFDPGRLEMTGEPIAIASGLQVGPGARSAFSVRDERLLAYRREGVGDTELRWVDRRGTVVGTVSSPGLHINPALSADGLRVAVGRTDAARQAWDVWVLDLTRTVWSRFTFDAGSEWLPAWSPDGRWVAFTKDRGTSKHDVYRKLSNNAGADELIVESPGTKGVSGWTPDGRAIVFHETSDSGSDINYVAVTGDRKPVSYLKTEFNERNGRVSPDGRWMAYESDESGRFEIYVRPFPDAQGGKWQISSDGGTDPRWRADGRELYYFSGDNTLTAVPVQPAGPELATGAPQPLFRASRTGNLTNYTVTPDGQRFLVNTVPESQPTSGITVVLNWLPAPRN